MSKNFMVERLTQYDGENFLPSRYTLKSKNDLIIAPYKTYELFFEIEFQVIQKLGAYEDIGTPEELKKLKEIPKGKWRRIGYDIFECTNCEGEVMTSDIDCYNFCHRCGADMREVEK